MSEEPLPDISELLGYDFSNDDPDLSKSSAREKPKDFSKVEEDLTSLLSKYYDDDGEDDVLPAVEDRYSSGEQYFEDTDDRESSTALTEDYSLEEEWEIEEESDGGFSWEDDEEEEVSHPSTDSFSFNEDSDAHEDFSFEEDEEEAEEEEVTEESAPVPPKMPVKEKKDKEKLLSKGEKKLSEFKEKFEKFKAQAAAELRGEDAPKEKPKPSTDLVPASEAKELEEAESEKETKGKKREKVPKKKGKISLRKLIDPFLRLYLSIVEFVFKFLQSILGFLGKIPVIGWPFKMLKELTKPLKIIAKSLPLLIVFGLLFFINAKAVPSQSTHELPDLGSATFTSFSFDKDSNTASGIVKNNGETIAEVVPIFNVYSMKPSLNPISWILPTKIMTCTSDVVRVDIDNEIKVQSKCDDNTSGLFVRVSGVLE